jgi:hypothetical protein
MALKPKKPTLAWKASLLYLQGPGGGNVQFTLQCYEIPKGSTINMSADATGPVPPISLLPTLVSTYPTFTTGIVVKVPADYQSNINFELYCDGKPPAGSTVSLVAGSIAPESSDASPEAGPVKITVVAEVTITN